MSVVETSSSIRTTVALFFSPEAVFVTLPIYCILQSNLHTNAIQIVMYLHYSRNKTSTDCLDILHCVM